VPILLLKLIVTPILIGGATLAARRWGPGVGGWLIALPLTSGPVIVFIAIDHGPAFASEASIGSLAGMAAIAGFCLLYSIVARRAGPAACLTAASGTFFAIGLLLQPVLDMPTWLLLGIVLGAITIVARRIPTSGAEQVAVPYPWWDIPARVVVGTTAVVAISAAAPVLGPHLSGLVATFPIYLTVLTLFTHRQWGAPAANDVLRGLLAGLYATSAFYVVVVAGIDRLGLAMTVACALVTTVAIARFTLRGLRPGLEPEPA
jgi:hypothetical protein